MADEPTQEQIDSIQEELAGGRKIGAIKIYREATGKGLKESKEFIDALAVRLKEEDPEKYAALATSTGGGCASVLLIAVGLTTAAAAWLGGLAG
jgi:ribosomal protein L7/L12